MKKIILTIIILLNGLGATSTMATADVQSYSAIENGESVEITVVQNQPMLRMANKTYTVRKISQLWSVSYKVSIKSNKITKVYGLKVKSADGRIINSSLRKNSSTKASWTGTLHKGFLKYGIHCITTVKKGKLKVS